jgi:hypothetical protein
MKYKCEFDDGLTDIDDQTDFERLRGKTWDEYLISIGASADYRKVPDRGWCEFCHLRRGTGMVMFLQGRPDVAELDGLEWILLGSVAQVCRPCARETGYTTGQVSCLVPKPILKRVSGLQKVFEQAIL